MMVTATKDNEKVTSKAFGDLKALEGWILELHKVELPTEQKKTYKKFYLMRPLGTLYDLKNH